MGKKIDAAVKGAGCGFGGSGIAVGSLHYCGVQMTLMQAGFALGLGTVGGAIGMLAFVAVKSSVSDDSSASSNSNDEIIADARILLTSVAERNENLRSRSNEQEERDQKRLEARDKQLGFN